MRGSAMSGSRYLTLGERMRRLRDRRVSIGWGRFPAQPSCRRAPSGELLAAAGHDLATFWIPGVDPRPPGRGGCRRRCQHQLRDRPNCVADAYPEQVLLLGALLAVCITALERPGRALTPASRQLLSVMLPVALFLIFVVATTTLWTERSLSFDPSDC